MRTVTTKAHPLASWQARQGGGRSGAGAPTYYNLVEPVALAVRKPGRGSADDGWCIVAKVTAFGRGGEPILATVWRSQRGTRAAISLPTTVLEYARQAGVKAFYLRDDRAMRMWTCPLERFGKGKLRPDGERYLPLAWLEPTEWRDWLYAERVVRLGTQEGRQLPLLEEVQR